MQFFLVAAFCVVAAVATPYGYGTAPVEIVKTVMPAYASYAAPAPVEIRKATIPILKYSLNDDNYGTFNFESLSGDGTSMVESGHLKNLGDLEGPVSVMKGAYSFVSDDGKTYTVNWVSDENGFQAVGDHLPVPPPMSPEIAESIRLNKAMENIDNTPLIRTSSYGAPVVKVMDSYAAPALKVFEPVVKSYLPAPTIRVSTY